ncbi:MAG: hypothetical protein KDI07_14395 [Anaerolineae bacterium]|nr:hypothetical protein [Anaerolineae bacterium]
MSILKGISSEIDVKCVARVRGDCGTVTDVPFVATFRTLKNSERLEFRKEAGRRMRETPEDWDHAEFVRRNLVGWKEFPTTTGEPLEFCPDNVEMVLEAIEYCDALYAGFLEVVNGAAKGKN